MKKLALSVLAAVAVLGSLAACGKLPEKAKEQPVQADPEPVKTYSKELKLDAILRGHPNSKKVCIDEGRNNAFFLDYSHIPESTEVGIFSRGWIFIEDVKFFEASNGKIFITEQDYAKYVRIYPDVIGMACKER